MKVNVLLFASLREAVGKSTIELDLSENATIAAVMKALGTAYPAILPHLTSVKVAVNRGFAGPDQELHPRDEVALLPPVGGG